MAIKVMKLLCDVGFLTLGLAGGESGDFAMKQHYGLMGPKVSLPLSTTSIPLLDNSLLARMVS